MLLCPTCGDGPFDGLERHYRWSRTCRPVVPEALPAPPPPPPPADPQYTLDLKMNMLHQLMSKKILEMHTHKYMKESQIETAVEAFTADASALPHLRVLFYLNHEFECRCARASVREGPAVPSPRHWHSHPHLHPP